MSWWFYTHLYWILHFFSFFFFFLLSVMYYTFKAQLLQCSIYCIIYGSCIDQLSHLCLLYTWLGISQPALDLSCHSVGDLKWDSEHIKCCFVHLVTARLASWRMYKLYSSLGHFRCLWMYRVECLRVFPSVISIIYSEISRNVEKHFNK